MFFRYFLIFLAFLLAIRILRGIATYLFPPVDNNGSKKPSNSGNEPSKKTKYKDVQDAKFKDVL